MSEDPNVVEEVLYNTETRSAFRRQTARQIYVPLVVAFLILVGLAVTLGVTGTGSFSTWADISLMFISIPAMILGIILLVLTSALVYGISWLIKAIPQPAWKVQQIFVMVAERVNSIADSIARPFIKVNALPAVFQRKNAQETEGEIQE
jgi:hypothetical protein